MLAYDIAERLSLATLPQNTLSNFSFDENCPLWSKDSPQDIPSHVLSSLKRYKFSKYGKVLGLEVVRYLSIYQNCLYYSEQPQGTFKGQCNLKNRYVEWHCTTTGRHLLLLSNSKDTSLLFFEDSSFWDEKKEEIVQSSIRTNYCQEYNELQTLGQGSFSIVVAVKSKHNGKIYAAKKINKVDRFNKCTKKLVIEERRILSILKDYPHTSRLIEFYQQNNEYVLIIQKMQGTDLLTFIKDNQQLTLEKMKAILTSILTCLKDLHERKIIHRDIKPQNIHIDSKYQCKLIDFGLSLNAVSADKSCFRKCGTIGYMAPQVFLNQFSYIRPYNQKCDLFSFGIVVHMLLMGSNPIKGKNYEETYELNRQCKIVLNRGKIVSKYGAQCFYFMQRLLECNARERFNAEQALNSSFLQPSDESSDQISRKLSTSTMDQKRKLSEQFFQK